MTHSSDSPGSWILNRYTDFSFKHKTKCLLWDDCTVHGCHYLQEKGVSEDTFTPLTINKLMFVRLPDTKSLSQMEASIQSGGRRSGGWSTMLLWDLSLAQPHLLHILHSARDTDCSLEKCLLQCWTSMCNIYHGGVRNFNLCFQNRLAAEVGSKQGVSFFFFFLFHFFV